MVFETKSRLKWLLPSLLALLLMVPALDSAPAKTRPVDICVAAPDGSEQFARLAYEIGGVDCATVYTLLGKRTDPPRLEYSAFPPGANINLVLRFPDDGEDHMLRRIILGAYDDRIRALARSIQSDGRKVTLRILHEGNGHWNPWGIFHAGKDGRFDNTADEYKAAWRHVVDVFRTVIPKSSGQVAFEMNINRRSTKPYPLSFAAMYPGAEYVDGISISSYDRCGTNAENTEPHSFASEFAPAYDEAARIIPEDMAINIAETSKLNACGTDRMKWFYDLFVSVENRFTRVRQITFFFVTVEPGLASNSVTLHWGLDELKGEPERFAQLVTNFRHEMRMPLPQYFLGDGSQRGTLWDESVQGKKAFTAPFTFAGRIEGFEKQGYGGQTFARLRGGWTQGFKYNWPEGYSFGPEFSLRATGVFPTIPDFRFENHLTFTARLSACRLKQIHDRDMSLQVCLFGEANKPYYEFPNSAPAGQKGWEGRVGVEFYWNGDLTELWP